MTYIIRNRASILWLCLIAVMFILDAALQPETTGITIRLGMIAIGGPLLLIAAGRSVIGIGQLSRQRFKEGRRSLGGVLALLTVLASGGLIMLGLFITNLLERNLGRFQERGLFSVDQGCVFQLAFVIGILLLFAAAGRSVVRLEQLSRQRFKEGRRLLGGVFALLTVLASGGLVILGWVITVFLGFVLLTRQ